MMNSLVRKVKAEEDKIKTLIMATTFAWQLVCNTSGFLPIIIIIARPLLKLCPTLAVPSLLARLS
jgi:hypothetical protein